MRYKNTNETINASGPAWAVAPHIKEEFPEVESAVRLTVMPVCLSERRYQIPGRTTVFADSAFFQVFDFKLMKGNPQTALKEPFSIVFTETAAKKYFGNADP